MRLQLRLLSALILIVSPMAHAADLVISTATTAQVSLVSTDNLTITNAGAINYTGDGGAVRVGTGVNQIVNNGTISATKSTSTWGRGIQLLSNSTIANGISNTGTITGFAVGIGVPTRGASVNGTITGGITNSGTIQISYPTNQTGLEGSVFSLSGVTVNGGINNSGTIRHNGTANQAGGIWLDSGSVINNGITNSGLIRSDGNAAMVIGTALAGTGTINNGIINQATGTIQANSVSAIRILGTGTVNGGIDNFGIIRTGGAGNGAIQTGNTSTINGGIDNEVGGILESTNSTGGGIFLNTTSKVDGTINNKGTITGGSDPAGFGIKVATGANITNGGIVNSGTISAGGNALELSNAANAFSVTNTGTISGNAALGINTLNLNGTAARVTGTTTGANATVNVNGTFSSENTFEVNTFNVNSGATFNMNNDVTVAAGKLNNAGTLRVDNASVNLTGDIVNTGTTTIASGQNLSVLFNSNSPSNPGNFDNSGTLIVNAGGSMSLQGTLTSSGTARIDGNMADPIALSGSGILQGYGVTGAISGSGSINPGNNSQGMLSSNSVNPSSGIGFNFEFSSFAPDYANAAASVNDVLKLSGETAFASALNTANNVRIYFDRTTINLGEVFTGGFFHEGLGLSDFTSSIQDANFGYYILGDGNGTATTYNGKGYYLLGSYLNNIALSLSTTPYAGSLNGYVMTLTSVVPEPSTYILAGMAATVLAILAKRRKNSVAAA